MSIEAMKLALDALEELMPTGSATLNLRDKAITALRQAIEQAEKQEHDLNDVRCECCGYMTYHREHMGCIKAAYQQAEKQEPAIQHLWECLGRRSFYLAVNGTEANMAPPNWLLDAEIFKLAVEVSNEEPELCARLAVEFQRVKESAYNAGLSAGIVAGAAAENEACAFIASKEAQQWEYPSHANAAAVIISDAIRARMK